MKIQFLLSVLVGVLSACSMQQEQKRSVDFHFYNCLPVDLKKLIVTSFAIQGYRFDGTFKQLNQFACINKASNALVNERVLTRAIVEGSMHADNNVSEEACLYFYALLGTKIARAVLETEYKKNQLPFKLFISLIDNNMAHSPTDSYVVRKLFLHADLQLQGSATEKLLWLQHFGVKGGCCLPIIRSILQTDASINVNENFYDRSVYVAPQPKRLIFEAVKFVSPEFVKLIIEERPNIDVNIENELNHTPLVEIIGLRNIVLLKEFLKHPAINLYYKDKSGKTVFDYLIMEHDPSKLKKMIIMLQEYRSRKV